VSEISSQRDIPSSPEWDAFREDLVDHRKRLERMLRRELVHDPRSATARLQNVAAQDLADDAICHVLDGWRSKPAGTTPFQWMAKHGLHLLDRELDREALAAESRAEERAEEGRLLAHDLMHDDEERARWLEMAGMGFPNSEGWTDPDAATDAEPPITSAKEAPHHFDGLQSPPDTSSPDERMQQAETLLELERAMLGLSETRRRAIAHRFLDGLDIEEICYLLDLPAEEVETEVRAGLATLRQELKRA